MCFGKTNRQLFQIVVGVHGDARGPVFADFDVHKIQRCFFLIHLYEHGENGAQKTGVRDVRGMMVLLQEMNSRRG